MFQAEPVASQARLKSVSWSLPGQATKFLQRIVEANNVSRKALLLAGEDKANFNPSIACVCAFNARAGTRVAIARKPQHWLSTRISQIAKHKGGAHHQFQEGASPVG